MKYSKASAREGQHGSLNKYKVPRDSMTFKIALASQKSIFDKLTPQDPEVQEFKTKIPVPLLKK